MLCLFAPFSFRFPGKGCSSLSALHRTEKIIHISMYFSRDRVLVWHSGQTQSSSGYRVRPNGLHKTIITQPCCLLSRLPSRAPLLPPPINQHNPPLFYYPSLPVCRAHCIQFAARRSAAGGPEPARVTASRVWECHRRDPPSPHGAARGDHAHCLLGKSHLPRCRGEIMLSSPPPRLSLSSTSSSSSASKRTCGILIKRK